MELIDLFAASLIGVVSVSTISNYIAGLCVWHIIHRLPWIPNRPQLDALLKAAAKDAPSSSKCAPRLPYTVDHILRLLPYFDCTCPLNTSVLACLTTAFYSCARLGELTVRAASDFDPKRHCCPLHLWPDRGPNSKHVTSILLSRTKTSLNGETISFATQSDATDPVFLLHNHLQVNAPALNNCLFAYCKDGSLVPLSRHVFLEHICVAAHAAELPDLNGHGFRIGGTLLYLLHGIPFLVVKTIGCWKSDAFHIYLRRHAQILAPYLQALPALHDHFLQFVQGARPS